MKSRAYLILALSLMLMLIFSVTVQAVSITHTWNFHTTCYVTGKCNDTWEPVGNVRTASSDQGLSVKVSGFAFTGGTGASLQAWLGQYLNTNGGLGVSVNTSDSHTVDNQGLADYVVFEFSTPVNVTSYYLNKFGDDADSTWYVGNLTSGFNFTGKTLAQVNTLGLTTGKNAWTSPGDTAPLETIATTVQGNYLILATRLDPTDRNDKFKIRTITATQELPDPVPEPGTLVLFGTGLAAIGFMAWRRSKRAKL
jgi:hypothetical protein